VEKLALLDGGLDDDVYIAMGTMAKVRAVVKAQRKWDKRRRAEEAERRRLHAGMADDVDEAVAAVREERRVR
jgi:hypothetical protein